MRDARGFDLSPASALDHNDLDEDAGMANVILTNGARLYVDHAHPEELAPAAARAVPTPGGGAGTDRPHRAHARPAGHKFSFWPPEHGDGHVRRWHHTACVTVPPDTRLGEYLTTQLRLVPGLLVTAGAVVVAFLATTLLPTVSSLLVAVALGAVGANAGLLRPAMRPGLAFTQRRVLRVGIVLLGLQLAVGDILGLGASGIGVVVLTVVLTFLGTLLLGRLLHVGRDLTVLVASGFSICGAAAVAAVHASTEADEEDVALAIALVTIYGTVAMIALPLVAGPLALTAARIWNAPGRRTGSHPSPARSGTTTRRRRVSRGSCRTGRPRADRSARAAGAATPSPAGPLSWEGRPRADGF
nr:putative sulfate exporter family transporter [Modestobacter muralis]